MPAVVQGVTRAGSLVIPNSRLFVVAFSVAVLALLYVFLRHTRTGRTWSSASCALAALGRWTPSR